MAGSKEGYWDGTNVVTDTDRGDVGKGKITDVGAQNAKLVIRYNGGPNAGHTVRNDKGEFILHGIPSGIFNPDAISVLATGVVVNPILLVDEIESLQQREIEISNSNLLISRDAHLIMPWHRTRDVLTEKARGLKIIGTTGQGIGPVYSDRSARVGLRVGDLLNPDFEKLFDAELAYQERLSRVMDGEALLSETVEMSADEVKDAAQKAAENKYYDRDSIWEALKKAREMLSPMITNTLEVIWKHKEKGNNILGEAGQGALLDLDLGGYPYVTSSHPGVAGFSIATGIHKDEIKRVIGVTKVYSTRVGEGPLPTELSGDIGDYIQTRGHEIGRTTGRKRRCGWFDGPAIKYGARIAGVNSIALTKLDVLDQLDEVKLGVGYEVGGRVYRQLTTVDSVFMNNATVVYEKLPGWNQDTTKARSFKELPENAQKFVHRIEEVLGLAVEIVSVGPERSAIFYR